MTADGRSLSPIPSAPNEPELQASPFFEETGAADKRQLGYADWLRRPRWERAAMVARDRLAARLAYWSAQWAQGKGLPSPQVGPG